MGNWELFWCFWLILMRILIQMKVILVYIQTCLCIGMNRWWKKHHAPTLLAFLTDIIGLAALRHDFGQTEMQQVSLKLYLTFVSDLWLWPFGFAQAWRQSNGGDRWHYITSISVVLFCPLFSWKDCFLKCTRTHTYHFS